MLSLAVKHPVKGADAVWFFKQGLSDKVKTAIAVYGDDDLDTVVMQAKRVDAAFSTSSAPGNYANVKGPGNAGAPKRAAGASGSAGDPKRVKSDATPPLIDLRKGEHRCTKCGKPIQGHPHPYGSKCAAQFAPATAEETKAMGKGKYPAA